MECLKRERAIEKGSDDLVTSEGIMFVHKYFLFLNTPLCYPEERKKRKTTRSWTQWQGKIFFTL